MPNRNDCDADGMANRRAIDPNVLFPIAAVAGVIFSTIAISIAVGYSPESGPENIPAAPLTTSAVPFQPPPPPIMMPDMGQVPCMGWTAADQGCAAKQ